MTEATSNEAAEKTEDHAALPRAQLSLMAQRIAEIEDRIAHLESLIEFEDEETEHEQHH